MPEYVTIQLQRPRGGFVGRIEEGWFTVRGETVVLTDRDGDALSRIAYRQKLSEGEDPRQIPQSPATMISASAYADPRTSTIANVSRDRVQKIARAHLRFFFQKTESDLTRSSSQRLGGN
jgi:hypothetical protein